jgi:hypothetical protein
VPEWRSQANRVGIYGREPSGDLYSPFNLRADLMKRLILVNFERDPDRIYSVFESQLFDDPVNGTGMLVIGVRRDGFVDVYHEPGLTIGHRDFAVAGRGLAEMIERPFGRAEFEVTRTGVELAFSFKDKEGRQIEVVTRERGSTPIWPTTILAPVGSGSVAPPALPLFFLHGFYLVRRAGTEASVRIGGAPHRPDTLPLPVDGSRVYFIRYSADPFLVEWNVARDGPLSPLAPGPTGEVQDGDAVYDVVDNRGHYEIRRVRASNGRHELAIDFDPPVPDIPALAEEVSIVGRFVISGDGSTGAVGGRYRLDRRSGKAAIRVQPTEGWKPVERKWSFRFLYVVARVFKNWPKTYVWNAEIDLSGDGQPMMRSRWKRTVPSG